MFVSEFCEHNCTPLVYQLPSLVARTNLSFVKYAVVYISASVIDSYRCVVQGHNVNMPANVNDAIKWYIYCGQIGK